MCADGFSFSTVEAVSHGIISERSIDFCGKYRIGFSDLLHCIFRSHGDFLPLNRELSIRHDDLCRNTRCSAVKVRSLQPLQIDACIGSADRSCSGIYDLIRGEGRIIYRNRIAFQHMFLSVIGYGLALSGDGNRDFLSFRILPICYGYFLIRKCICRNLRRIHCRDHGRICSISCNRRNGVRGPSELHGGLRLRRDSLSGHKIHRG